MNLIEQLGGHEKAKRELQLKIDNSVLQCCMSVTADMIRDALLEHRREKNIFEVGDFVLPISSEFSNEVLELTEDYVSFDFKYKSRNGGFGYIVKSFMPTRWRHATDKEIAQGYRDA